MDDHLSRHALRRVFSGRGTPPEAAAAIPHLTHCPPCWSLTADVVEELRRDRALIIHRSDPRAAVLTLLDEEQREDLEQLRAAGWWLELWRLSQEEQLDRIKSVAALRTREMYEIVLAAASAAAADDPLVGEETALTARALAALLPGSRYPKELKSDLQGEAMTVVGNCRRLAADFSASRTALKEAGDFLKRGSGAPSRQARLLSVSASLAIDTGSFEAARRLLTQVAALNRKDQDLAGLAKTAVQEAGCCLAGLLFADAITCAEEALRALAAPDLRLEMLARSIVTEGLIELGRPHEALRSFRATRPLYAQLGGRRLQLRVAYLTARLNDSFGRARESEKAFREAIRGCVEEELYKDAFLITLTLFESLHKRGAFAKAMEVCEEASRLLATPLCHAQLRQVWADLRARVAAQAFTVSDLLEARLYFARHWSVPASRLPAARAGDAAVAQAGVALVLAELEAAAEPEPEVPAPIRPERCAGEPAPAPPAPPLQLAEGGYEQALEAYDRQLIAAALEQSGGSVRAAARLLQISRTTLKARVSRYGLTEDGRDAAGTSGS